MDVPAYLTVPEAAKALKVSAKTIYRLIKEGKLPSSRAGRAIRIPVEALEALRGA